MQLALYELIVCATQKTTVSLSFTAAIAGTLGCTGRVPDRQRVPIGDGQPDEPEPGQQRAGVPPSCGPSILCGSLCILVANRKIKTLFIVMLKAFTKQRQIVGYKRVLVVWNLTSTPGITYLRECALGHGIEWLHVRSDGLVSHRPSHSHSNHTCISAQSLRDDVEAASAAAVSYKGLE